MANQNPQKPSQQPGKGQQQQPSRQPGQQRQGQQTDESETRHAQPGQQRDRQMGDGRRQDSDSQRR